MRTTIRGLLAGVLLPLALLGGVGAALVIPPATAEASPDARLIPVKQVRYPYSKLSKSQKTKLNAAASINKNALSKTGKTLYYDKANKYDKGQTTVRRQFAAVYVWKGLSVKNISKAELKKVKAISAKWPKRKSCDGKSGYAYNKKGMYWTIHFNSCETRIVILAAASAGVLVGLASPLAGPGWTAPATAAAILEIGALLMSDARDRSLKRAIFFIGQFLGPKMAKVHVVGLYPQ